MARRKCIVCFGQSNMEGEALLSELPSGVLSKWIGQSSTAINTAYRIPGINAWQADLKTSSTIAAYTGKFTPSKFHYDTTATWAGAADGYGYSTTITRPLANGPIDYATQKFGPDVELAWQLQHELTQGEDLYVIKLAIHSTYLSKFTTNTSTQNARWLDYDDALTSTPFVIGHNDWHPSSTAEYGLSPAPTDNTKYDLFGVLCDIIFPQAAAWISANNAGDTLDVIGVFMKLGESDSLDSTRAALALQNATAIRDAMRERISTRGMTSKTKEKIPFIIAGHDTSVWTYGSTVNAAFAQMAADDPYTGYFDTTGYPKNTGDTAHINATGMVTLGQAFYTKWKEIVSREADATTQASRRPSLSTLRSKVKRRYERNDVSNDATNTQVDMFLNDSLREVYNTLGDNAWFLRRMETLTTSASYPDTLNLPLSVGRLLRIENSAFPGKPLVYKGIGYTDQGRAQITLMDYSGGPFIAHFIATPQDLEQDADLALIPMEYLELVVMLTCKRLTEAAGNMTMAQYYAAETERLWKYVRRDCLRRDRFKNDALTTIDSYDNWTGGSFPGALGNL